MRTTIDLPWPPPSLSPNRRQHWSRLARAKAAYRAACKLTVESMYRGASVPDGALALTLTFSPPDRRSYDRDNLLARMKAGIDGACDALGIDDVRFTTTTVRVDAAVKGGTVRIDIEPDGKR